MNRNEVNAAAIAETQRPACEHRNRYVTSTWYCTICRAQLSDDERRRRVMAGWDSNVTATLKRGGE